AQATCAPTSANASAIPAPMPRPAPVTIATFPSRRNRSRIMRHSFAAVSSRRARSRRGFPAVLMSLRFLFLLHAARRRDLVDELELQRLLRRQVILLAADHRKPVVG